MRHKARDGDQIKVKACNRYADWATSLVQCVRAKLGQDIKGCRRLLRDWKVKGWKVKGNEALALVVQ